MMSQLVATSTKNVVFLAHTLNVLNEAEMVSEVKVPVKGALKNNGIESFFSVIISTKKVPINKLTDKVAKSKFLTITEEEEDLGIKYVFQTQITKDTINERMRGPMDPRMWERNETFIDNDLQLVLDRLHKYYK